MKNLLITICEEVGYVNPHNLCGITLDMLVDGALSGNIVAYVRNKTGCAKETVTRALKSSFPDRDAIHDRSLVQFILSKWDLKLCTKCSLVKEDSEFYYNSSKLHGLSDTCKTCSKEARKTAYNKDPQKELAANKSRKLGAEKRTPVWADLSSISEFYRLRPEGYHVDHIIPLHGELVSGLHVLENLQYLPANENLRKSNTFVP